MKKLTLIAFAILTSLYVFSQKPTHDQLIEKHKLKHETEYGNINPLLVKFLKQNQCKPALFQFKNANANKLQLDSIISNDINKEEFIYDSNDEMTTDSYSEWDNDKWFNYYKVENIRDESGKIVQANHYYQQGGNWVLQYKDEYTYASDDKLLTKISYMQESGSEWTIRYKYELEYDDAGNMTLFKYDINSEITNNQLLPYYKALMHYDSKNNLILIVEFAFAEDEIGYDRRTNYTYNSSGKATQIIEELWTVNQWINYTKINNQYKSDGNLSHSDIYDWDPDYEEWLSYLTYDYEYNDMGNMTLYDVYLDDINYIKEEWIYDDNNNMTEYTYSYYDSDFGELIPMMQEVYEYDNSYSYEDLILPQFSTVVRPNYEATDYSKLFSHKLNSISYFEDNGTTLDLISKEEFFYSEDNATGIASFSSDDIVKLYPNPATNQVTFQLGTDNKQFDVTIYNVLGDAVFNNSVKNNTSVFLQSFDNGLYFYRLMYGEKTYSGKLIVNN